MRSALEETISDSPFDTPAVASMSSPLIESPLALRLTAVLPGVTFAKNSVGRGPGAAWIVTLVASVYTGATIGLPELP